jgi:MFS family permease
MLDKAIGGWRGVIDSGVPTLLFISAYVVTGQQLRPSLVVAVAAGLVIAGWRLLRREPLQQVLAGFFGVAVSAFVAARTGRAENYFLMGILINVGYALAYLASILARWPLMGLVVGYFRGDATGWRDDPRQYAAYVTSSWIWVGMFSLRLVVQVPLLLAGAVGALGAAKLIMGWPMFLLAAWLTYRVLHPVLSAADAHSTAHEPAGELEPEAG